MGHHPMHFAVSFFCVCYCFTLPRVLAPIYKVQCEIDVVPARHWRVPLVFVQTIMSIYRPVFCVGSVCLLCICNQIVDPQLFTSNTTYRATIQFLRRISYFVCFDCLLSFDHLHNNLQYFMRIFILCYLHCFDVLLSSSFTSILFIM